MPYPPSRRWPAPRTIMVEMRGRLRGGREVNDLEAVGAGAVYHAHGGVFEPTVR